MRWVGGAEGRGVIDGTGQGRRHGGSTSTRRTAWPPASRLPTVILERRALMIAGPGDETSDNGSGLPDAQAAATSPALLVSQAVAPAQCMFVCSAMPSLLSQPSTHSGQDLRTCEALGVSRTSERCATPRRRARDHRRGVLPFPGQRMAVSPAPSQGDCPKKPTIVPLRTPAAKMYRRRRARTGPTVGNRLAGRRG